ncbi:LysR family transcriptional regulator [Miniphocaeibacter massiliensis]|uniref:LysR family transcriptional regulator n=1 Tax=Miniphocaeibacter massiliensis TaxID=2041841 RepID=UPI000C1C7FBB|nr:LysR family transcriptional regulator [Miniphocaeibacter massiliensis]
MEIRQLQYILTIVKSHFNLTKASQLLFISQPALSKMITTIESQIGIQIFERRKGRLVDLTPAGKVLVKHANNIVSAHNEMNTSIRKFSNNIVGNVKIGIPSMILEVLFIDIISKLILENPNILFEIIENSATLLNKKFLNSEIDILISISDDYKFNNIEKKLITSEALVAIMNVKNPLTEKDYLDWEDLNSLELALPNDRYSTYHIVKNKLIDKNIKSDILVSAASYKFLIESASNSNLITILPKIFYDSITSSNDYLVFRKFKDPIFWDVEISTKKDNLGNNSPVGFAYELLLNHF